MTGVTWLPWGWLTWWVTSLVRGDGEEGVDNGCPLLEQSEDHLQPLWAQQLEKLEGEWKSVAANQNYSLLWQTQETNHPTHTHPTCKYILWLTSTPKLAATAKSEHLVITMRLVENMLCCLATQTQSHLALSKWQKNNNKSCAQQQQQQQPIFKTIVKKGLYRQSSISFWVWSGSDNKVCAL